MSYGIRPPGKWNEAFVNKITFKWSESLKYVNITKGVYGVLGFFNEPFLSFCDVRWNAAMACISTRN